MDKNPEFLPVGDDNEQRELTTQEARQGVRAGTIFVLVISLALLVSVFALIYFKVF